jgi:hypothetical protein
MQGRWYQLGNGRGWGNPDGLRVRVPCGSGTGYDSPTRELSNESKNIFFGAKLKELQLILQIALNWLYLLQFWADLDIFGLVLTGKPVGLRHGSGTGC